MGQDSWNLGGVVVSRKLSPSNLTWTISEMQYQPLLSSTAKMVHEAGRGASEVTLAYLQKHDLGFEVPHVHHHEEYNGRYYIILSRVGGLTLEKAWPTMNDANKEYYVRRVAEICAQLAQWEGESTISGVDGRNLSDQFLADKNGTVATDDLSPPKLLENCKGFGLECSQLVFYHCDLGPGNIIVNLGNKTIGIIDWESAGWVPIEWVRTKHRVPGRMDLDFEEHEMGIEWRRRVQLELGKRGFPEAADKWNSWRRSLRGD